MRSFDLVITSSNVAVYFCKQFWWFFEIVRRWILEIKGPCSKFSSSDFVSCFARFLETPASPFNPNCMLWEAIILYIIITRLSHKGFTKLIAPKLWAASCNLQHVSCSWKLTGYNVFRPWDYYEVIPFQGREWFVVKYQLLYYFILFSFLYRMSLIISIPPINASPVCFTCPWIVFLVTKI